ncbi:PREDICTED: thioredoxin domain-containing protein 12-like [Eufriesea mexicana]|uniref:thioredoxin domain-containing protein 12-like n=1 Tax=Eufriesea mexicana TaxID=516756 RepID=UPI00083C0B05|nr:PREDICTED: thioredoxin domain-containing protein 12-like [Eufriesea mexicana]
MNQCIKYFSALNLINLANHIVGNKLVNTRDSNFEASFEQLFKWRSLKYGFQEAKVSNKPIFLLIYKLQCPSCQKLKQNFSKSVRLMDLSDRFIMIKADMENDAILNKKMFQPDGKYVPRILFFTSDGNFIEEAYNKHADADTEYKYFYKNPSQVINTMLFVLKNYSKQPLPVMFEQSLKLESNNIKDDILTPTIS